MPSARPWWSGSISASWNRCSTDAHGRSAPSGMYNNMNMMHQYGAGGQDVLLMSNTGAEPVSSQGGRCPASAPVKQYDVSAINVEISLNMWLDYYPGYMYVLDGEHRQGTGRGNEESRRRVTKEGYDPGAVTNGLQNQWIQPLAIRGNQGDCVKITLRNQLEGGEDVSLHIHGSSMVVSRHRQAGHHDQSATASPRKARAVDLEWYIPPTHAGRRPAIPLLQQRPRIDGDGAVRHVRGRAERVGVSRPARHRAIRRRSRAAGRRSSRTAPGRTFVNSCIIYHEVGDEAFRPVNKQRRFHSAARSR